MRYAIPLAAAVALLAAFQIPVAAQRAAPEGPIANERFRTDYVRLALRDADGLLYTPLKALPQRRVALVYAHPSGNNFAEPVGAQMASRGHFVLMVNFHRKNEPDDAYAPGISQAIRYLRTLPGVERVVIVGHSGGGHLAAFYQNVAENGAGACSGAEKLYPCKKEMVTGMERPDGIILLDPTLGALHQMSSLDPAFSGKRRIASLDMFTTANGYDRGLKAASYTPAFAARFHGAQSARNAKVVGEALARLKLLESGKGRFADDEPFTVPAMGVTSSGVRLYQPDVAFLSETRAAHLLLKADGTQYEGIVRSVRPPTGQQAPEILRSLEQMAQNTTVRRFLGNSAIRTSPDFAITRNDIQGVDWASAFSSTPANAEGISAPALVLTMSCHYLVVPGEIIFNRLGSDDKTMASVEGATHLFTPCKPEYGDTVMRTFDFVGGWLDVKGRF